MNHQGVSKTMMPFLPLEIEGVSSLLDLALDLRWSWNHAADEVWRQLDPELWEHLHNPWNFLRTVSWDKIKEKMSDPAFRKRLDDLVKLKKKEDEAPGWFQQNHANSPLKTIAYFSMEYMLSEGLPIYSGGLGNVAGDQLKTASDLGVPVIAIGLLYQQGYFRQGIDKDGNQQAFYPFNAPSQLPITPLRKSNGEWLRLTIDLPGYKLYVHAWQVTVGKVRLFLLDTNDPGNYPPHRGIASELYGGGPELRLQQELLLGIGGWRLMEALGIRPEVCHLNEGHAAFVVLERARSFMKETGQSFDVALEATRAGNLFTTHTAVPAGFDRFSPALMAKYAADYAQNQLKISFDKFLGFGRTNPSDPTEDFNMACLALRGSAAVNGVSRLHGQVSRQLFQPLFPHWPQADVPVGYVTNGVHMPSWDSATSDQFWEECCGKLRWLKETEVLAEKIRQSSDIKLWNMRTASRQALVEYTRKRLGLQLAFAGASPEEVETAKHIFDPHTLTLGFARRFATYKRPNMLLQDPERFLRILKNPNRPVQLIIAGKAHPADKQGQAMIRQWIQFIRSTGARSNVVFLSDYDMFLTEQLVQGVDVWVNTPRRPWEACGTSGMKVLVNGGLNLSELDGWWAEAYTPEVGWALGDGKERGEDPLWDAAEANALYDLLENQIVPEFYARDAEGVPLGWIARIRESMALLTPRFSANRTVREYTETYYLPLAQRYLARAENQGEKAKQIVEWRKKLDACWSKILFGELKVETVNDQHQFEIQIYLDGLDHKEVRVELYAEGDAPIEMACIRHLLAEKAVHLYRAMVPASRPASEYTPRVIPSFDGVSVPLEAAHIHWQH